MWDLEPDGEQRSGRDSLGIERGRGELDFCDGSFGGSSRASREEEQRLERNCTETGLRRSRRRGEGERVIRNWKFIRFRRQSLSRQSPLPSPVLNPLRLVGSQLSDLLDFTQEARPSRPLSPHPNNLFPSLRLFFSLLLTLHPPSPRSTPPADLPLENPLSPRRSPNNVPSNLQIQTWYERYLQDFHKADSWVV